MHQDFLWTSPQDSLFAVRIEWRDRIAVSPQNNAQNHTRYSVRFVSKWSLNWCCLQSNAQNAASQRSADTVTLMSRHLTLLHVFTRLLPNESVTLITTWGGNRKIWFNVFDLIFARRHAKHSIIKQWFCVEITQHTDDAGHWSPSAVWYL